MTGLKGHFITILKFITISILTVLTAISGLFLLLVLPCLSPAVSAQGAEPVQVGVGGEYRLELLNLVNDGGLRGQIEENLCLDFLLPPVGRNDFKMELTVNNPLLGLTGEEASLYHSAEQPADPHSGGDPQSGDS